MSRKKSPEEKAIEEFEKEWEQFEKTGGYEGISDLDLEPDILPERKGGAVSRKKGSKIMKGYKAGGKV